MAASNGFRLKILQKRFLEQDFVRVRIRAKKCSLFGILASFASLKRPS